MIGVLKKKITNTYWSMLAQHTHRHNQKKVNPQPFLTNHIGILYTQEPRNPEKTPAVLRFAQHWESLGKVVKILCYQPQPNNTTNNPIPSFSRQEFSFWGKSSNPSVIHFLGTPFTYLYYLDWKSEPLIDLLITNCQAKYKIAPFIPEKIHLFEVSVKTCIQPTETPNFDQLFTTLGRQVQSLQLS